MLLKPLFRQKIEAIADMAAIYISVTVLIFFLVKWQSRCNYLLQKSNIIASILPPFVYIFHLVKKLRRCRNSIHSFLPIISMLDEQIEIAKTLEYSAS